MTAVLDSEISAVEICELGPNSRNLLYELGRILADAYGGPAGPRCRHAIAELAAGLTGELADLVALPAGDAGVRVLRGLRLDSAELGRTPPSWAAVNDRTGAPIDLQMLLLATMIGSPFGWCGQQEGRLVNNVVPARGYERIQTGASSEIVLSPHTEDAFHPLRAHAFLLGCVRNPDRVATTIASIRRVQLSAATRQILLRPTVPILPDLTYGDLERWPAAKPVPVLWERPDGLCIRYDPDYTPWRDAGPQFRAAYAELGAELARVADLLVLEPGDVAIIDNDVVVHGRVPFTARFDGTDRWLKRVNIAVAERFRPARERTERGYGQRVTRLLPPAQLPAGARR